jgi:hypothetical protein
MSQLPLLLQLRQVVRLIFYFASHKRISSPSFMRGVVEYWLVWVYRLFVRKKINIFENKMKLKLVRRIYLKVCHFNQNWLNKKKYYFNYLILLDSPLISEKLKKYGLKIQILKITMNFYSKFIISFRIQQIQNQKILCMRSKFR